MTPHVLETGDIPLNTLRHFLRVKEVFRAIPVEKLPKTKRFSLEKILSQLRFLRHVGTVMCEMGIVMKKLNINAG